MTTHSPTLKNVDVLCVGHASYDLIFSVSKHPQADEKTVAVDFFSGGGGPAANAAVMVSKLGLKAAFSGYLSKDLYGEKHFQEFIEHHVCTDFIKRDKYPTPLSNIIVKPNGDRSLINYKNKTPVLEADSMDLSPLNPKVILFDGHEPKLSLALVEQNKDKNIPTVLDAGSVHKGTLALMNKVDYLVCSEKFALEYNENIDKALETLSNFAPFVIITLGKKGLIWQCGSKKGTLTAYKINAIDSTGAGDAFHGAFSAAVALKLEWQQILHYASAAGALCCQKIGARSGLPSKQEHFDLLNKLELKS